MSYQVLARKWRPAQFADVVGQAHVVSALSNALDQNRVHHAFLFTGTRGVGKTTLARIFAKALNCAEGVSSTPCGKCVACEGVAEGRFIDLIEVDAASRTRVDDTRELLENVQYAPTQGRYKVYLIDEVHMLSTHSFNALLKTLEEPPEHVKFLLATTDPQKLPMTVLSRCIQFSLNAIEPHAIEKQLFTILDAESIEYEPMAISLLARAADGSMRDALSLLDQAIAYSDRQVNETSVRDMLGLVDGQTVVSILEALAENDITKLMQNSAQLVNAAQDMQTALDDLLSFLHALSLFQFSPDAVEWKGLAKADLERLAKSFTAEAIQLYYQIVTNGKRDFSLAPDPRTGFEMVLLRLMAFRPARASEDALKPPPVEQKTGGKQASDSPTEDKPASSARPMQNPADSKAESATVSPDYTLAEESSPFLTDGLQNPELKQHLKSASAIAQVVDDPHVDVPVTASAPEQDGPEKPRASSSFLPEGMLEIEMIINNISVWSDFVMKVGLTGIARQLAMHMTPLSFSDGVLHLQLDQQYRNLYSEGRAKQIQDGLITGSGQDFQLNIEFGEVAHTDTAAGVIAERERSNLDKTRKEFKQDENVKEVMAQFSASLDETSIKPVN